MQVSQDLQNAEAHDNAGRHDAALTSLVHSVRAGEAEGMTRLGKRLLVGDRAPHKPVDAVSLLEEAGDKGNAEAPAILCVMQALGLHMRQNWTAALNRLTLAASRGWTAAQDQLQVLGNANRDDVVTSWQQLAAGIDLAAWMHPPAALTLCQEPLICSYPDFISPAASRWIIARARGRLHRARVYDAVSQSVSSNNTRTNSAAVFNLLETDLVNVLVQTKMAACAGVSIRNLEALSVLHYAQGQQITEHFDFVDPGVPGYEEQIMRDGQRIITFLLYLNNEYGGGETAFPRLGINHRGQAGEGMFFTNALADGSADVRTLHAGRPPLQGEKWIVSQFIRNRQVF